MATAMTKKAMATVADHDNNNDDDKNCGEIVEMMGGKW
jgi:hypothetical protein